MPLSVLEVFTRRQRNNIFDALRTQGVDPARCRLLASENPSSGHSGVEIFHDPTGSWFDLIPEPTRYVFSWRVQDGPKSEDEAVAREWEHVLGQLGYWAGEVAYVAENPDLWEELQQVPEILAAAQSDDASNAPFTADEQAEIGHRLDEVERLAREQFELTAEQLAAISQRLDDAKESSKRLGRKDWLMAFYGGLMSTAITDAVPPGVIQTALTVVVHGLAHLFGFGGGLPPIIST